MPGRMSPREWRKHPTPTADDHSLVRLSSDVSRGARRSCGDCSEKDCWSGSWLSRDDLYDSWLLRHSSMVHRFRTASKKATVSGLEQAQGYRSRGSLSRHEEFSKQSRTSNATSSFKKTSLSKLRRASSHVIYSYIHCQCQIN